MREPSADDSLLTDIAEEFAVRRRAGEPVSVEEYAGRHPARAKEVRAVLSAVSVLEKGKRMPGSLADGPSRFEPAFSDRVGDYRLVRELGRGGMGIVYEAVHATLGRRVALKLLPAQAVPDENQRLRFRREAQAAARLHHTNIVPVFEAGEIGGRCYYAMQLIPGRGLDGVIAESVDTPARPGACDSEVTLLGKRIPTANAQARVARAPGHADKPVRLGAVAPEGNRSPREWVRRVTRIGLQVADALAHAHAHGVLHRDIKPSNLLLDEEGVVWVTDFGVAKVLEERDLTGPGEMVGTLRYMAPERFSGQSDARGDVYSLGVTLYELLTLRPAFPDSSQLQMMRLVSDADGVAPRTWNPAVPRDLETVIQKATARDPAHRYPTAGELADDLRRVLDDRPVRARRIGPAERSWRWCRRNPALATATTAAAVLLVAVGGVLTAACVRSESASCEVARANADLEKALAAETAQRADAERTAALTLGAMSRTYARLAPTRGATSPLTQDGTDLHLPPPGAVAPEIVPILEDLLATYEQIAASAERFPALRTQAAEAYHRIGDIGRRLGRHEAAVAAYSTAVERYGEPTAAAGMAARVRVAQACNDLGLVLKSLQRLDESEAAHNRAVRLLTAPPAAVTGRPECRFELAWAYYALGRRDMFQSAAMSQKLNRGPLAATRPPSSPTDHRAESPPPRRINLGWRAIELLEPLTQEFPNAPEYRHLLACCYRDLPPAPGSGSRGGPTQAVELLRELAREFPQVPEYLYDLCGALAHPQPGDRPGVFSPLTRTNLQEAIRVSGELATRYPAVPEYTAAQARYLDRLGRKLLETGQVADALPFHRKAVGLQTRLVQQHPDAVTYATWLGLMEHALGQELSAAGEWAEARAQMTSGIARVEAAWRKETRLDGLRTFLGMAYASLADALERSGEADRATEARRKAGEFERIGREYPPGPRGGLRP